MGEHPMGPRDKHVQFRDWLKQQDWTFAKTYADGAPHEYIWLEDHGVSEQMHKAFGEFIEEYGRHETYYGDPYTVYDVDNYKYWRLGYCLNRRSYDGYDIINKLREMGEDPSEHVDTDKYEAGKLYHPAEKNPES